MQKLPVLVTLPGGDADGTGRLQWVPPTLQDSFAFMAPALHSNPEQGFSKGATGRGGTYVLTVPRCI